MFAAFVSTLQASVALAFLDPNEGRWIQRDPVGEYGGLNLYVYVDNNPINAVDPLGLEIFCHGDDQFQKDTAEALDKLSSEPNGKILVNLLKNSPNPIYIVKTDKYFDNATMPRDPSRAINGQGTGSIIKWDPNSFLGGKDDKGSMVRPPFIGLGHELGHARDFDRGQGNFNYNPVLPNTTPPAEDTNLKRENLLRNENNLTPRSYYYCR